MKCSSGFNNFPFMPVHVCVYVCSQSNNRKENLMCPLKVTICCSVIHLHFASSLPWFHMTIHPAGTQLRRMNREGFGLFFLVCNSFMYFLHFLSFVLFFSPHLLKKAGQHFISQFFEVSLLSLTPPRCLSLSILVSLFVFTVFV